MQKIAVTPIFTGVTAILLSSNCQRRDYNTKSEKFLANMYTFLYFSHALLKSNRDLH